MVVRLLGNESFDLNRITLVTPKSENDVRLRATIDSQNPTGLTVGAVRFDKIGIRNIYALKDRYNGKLYNTYETKENRVCICDVDFKEKFKMDRYPSYTVNGKFITSDDYACTCYDEKGEIIFSYSFISFADD